MSEFNFEVAIVRFQLAWHPNEWAQLFRGQTSETQLAASPLVQVHHLVLRACTNLCLWRPGSLSRSVIRALFALVLQPLLIRESQDIERAKATSPELDVFRKWVMPIRRSRCEGGCDSGRQERVLKRPASRLPAFSTKLSLLSSASS